MSKVGIVILNYLNYYDTVECLESFFSLQYVDKEIIVVDNGSINESADYLLQYKQSSNSKFHLIVNNENCGFAKGNNIGIIYARDKLKCDFVLIANNDTVCIDRELLNKLIHSYQRGIGVIGPRIISRNGYEQNPVGELDTKNETYQFKVYPLKRIRKFIKYDLRIFKTIVHVFKKYGKRFQNVFFRDEVISESLVLHGSCFLLTPCYFKYYPYLYPKTFLYYEENILTILTYKAGLKKKFVSNTKIFHKEDQSSLLSFNNDQKIKNKYERESIGLAKELLTYNYQEVLNEFNNG